MKGEILVHQLSYFTGIGQTIQVKPIKCSRNILVCVVRHYVKGSSYKDEQGFLYLRVRAG